MNKKSKNIYTFNNFGKNSEDNNEIKKKAEAMSNYLFNSKICLLCELQFTFDSNLPRILVQCGHSICSFCVKELLVNDELCCPFCQTSIKGITNIDFLPVNQQIFFTLQKSKEERGNKSMARNWKSEYSDDRELKYCETHRKKLKHFYCVHHDVRMCRSCFVYHKSVKNCEIIDLYELNKNKNEI